MNRFFECSQCSGSEDIADDLTEEDDIILATCIHRRIAALHGDLSKNDLHLTNNWLHFTRRYRRLPTSYLRRKGSISALRLRLAQIVHRGFNSSVWLCDMVVNEHNNNKQQLQNVAMKIIHKQKCSDDEMSRLSSEVRVLKKVKHPHIIRLISSVDSINEQLMFLEFAPFGDLYEITAFKVLEEDTARWIIFQALLALQELHCTQNILHGDIKAKNFLLFPSQDTGKTVSRSQLLRSGSMNIWEHIHVKLSDFGFSQNVPISTGLVPFTGIRGTVGFLAPEILCRQDYSYSIDLWGLGVVTYTLLAGYEPFYPSSMCLTHPVEFDHRYWKDISPLCKNFISSLLTKDPLNRLTASEALTHPWISTIYT